MTFEKFGSYLLIERIANGGMAAIFLARPHNTAANGRILIIKRMLPEVALEPDFLKMFQSEIQLCMGLNHPNIIQIFDFGDIDGQPYIAMEYVEGKNLRQILEQHEKMGFHVPVDFCLSITMQVAAALHYAHTFKNRLTGEPLQVIHRDISPQNLLVTYEGNVKLIDFGIAKTSSVLNGTITLSKSDQIQPEATRAGTIKGKICYLSPEQVNEERLDGRTDVFSLGAVLWELLTGKKVFEFDSDLTQAKMLSQIKNCGKLIRRPSEYNEDVPKELDQIVLKALAENREERYRSAEEFQIALRNFMMSKYPNTSYRTVSAHMNAVFQTVRQVERIRIKELNDQAQRKLSNHSAAESTSKIEATPPVVMNIPKLVSTGSMQLAVNPPLAQNVQVMKPMQHHHQNGQGGYTAAYHNALATNSIGRMLTKFSNQMILLAGIYSWGVLSADAFWKFLDAKEEKMMAQIERKMLQTQRFANTRAPAVEAVPQQPLAAAVPAPARVENTAIDPAQNYVQLSFAVYPEGIETDDILLRVNGRSLDQGAKTIRIPLTSHIKVEAFGTEIKPYSGIVKIEPIKIGNTLTQTVILEVQEIQRQQKQRPVNTARRKPVRHNRGTN